MVRRSDTQPLDAVRVIADANESIKAIEIVKAMLRDEDEAVNWVLVRDAILELGVLRLTPDSPLPGAMPPWSY